MRSPRQAESTRRVGEASTQDAVIAFLSDPATHGGQEVERVDTHISHLFLAGERAYKLKRAVRTNFLDFSTPELREAACRREIEVNAGAAGKLYLGVLPVVVRDGALTLGGPGDAIDWLVEMRRFDREGEFDRLAERGELTVALMERLADTVARMHCEAPVTPGFGGSARVRATIVQIAEAIMQSPQAEALERMTAEWRKAAEALLDRLAPQIDARRRHGYVRRCHGDLHLGNICMVDGRPTPFDALEFNEEMASTDLLYDIAFTVMDLQERGLHAQMTAFLSRYLAATRDYSGMALLPLFVSMRAAVRALVAASRDAPDPHEPDAGERLSHAITVLDDAPRPMLVAVGGLSGSGKSTVARRIAPALGECFGALLLRSDVARKTLFGVAPEDTLPADAYAPDVSRRLYRQLFRDAARALRAGISVVLDATFLSPSQKQRPGKVASALGIDFHGLWLDCSPGELRRRILARRGDASDADLSVLDAQLACAPTAGDWTPVPADGTAEATAAHALDALGPRAGRGRAK